MCVIGVHQGCPLGSLLYCFGVLAVLQRVLLKFPFVRIPSIADDMTLVGPQLDVAAAFVELKIGLGEIGLSVAAHKCKAICATSIHPKARELLEAAGLSDENKSFPSDGIVLCGAPVSADFKVSENSPVPYERDSLCEIISRNDEGNAKIMRLADGQAKYLIVRYCCAARDSFFLRCVDPVSSELGALKHEEMVAKMLAGVLKFPGGPPENDTRNSLYWAFRQARLPLRHGGLGTPPASLIRSSAYYGSL